MKPRIFLFSDSEEADVQMLTSLLELERLEFNFLETKYFVHVGFNPPSRQSVEDLFYELPLGVYCSGAFKEANPGELWGFSEKCGALNEATSVFLVRAAPILNFIVLDRTLEVISQLAQSWSRQAGFSSRDEVELIPDEELSYIDFSVRTKNVFEKEGIRYLSDLVKLSEAFLLRLPNFGRKSLHEIKEFLSQRDLKLEQENLHFSEIEKKEINPRDLVSDSIERDVASEIDKLSDHRMVEILRSRVGFGGHKTLENISDIYGVTRERIRQIEKKGIEKILLRKGNLLSLWNKIILELVQKSTYPIELEKFAYLDKSFASIECRSEDIVKFLITQNKRKIVEYDNQLEIVRYQGQRLVSEITQEELDDVRKFILNILVNSRRQPLDVLKAECFRFSTEVQQKYFNLIFDSELVNCLISKDHDGQEIFIKYVKQSNIELAMYLLIEHIDSVGPLKTDDVHTFVANHASISPASLMNALANNDDIFPYRHGEWTTFSHLDFTENDRQLIVRTAEDKLAGQPYLQLHCRELESELKDDLSGELNFFAIAGILKKYSDLQYLGRSVFCGKDAQLEQRFYIHDAIVNVLRANERPMHASELIEEARQFVSISETYSPQIKPPVVNIGNNTYALDYWDI